MGRVKYKRKWAKFRPNQKFLANLKRLQGKRPFTLAYAYAVYVTYHCIHGEEIPAIFAADMALNGKAAEHRYFRTQEKRSMKGRYWAQMIRMNARNTLCAAAYQKKYGLTRVERGVYKFT